MERFRVYGGWKTVVAVIAGVLVLSACTPRTNYTPAQREAKTAPTAYQAGGYPKILGVRTVVNPFDYPYGYQEEKLGASSYLVISEATVYTNSQQTFDIMLFRAAELGQQGGFDKFRLSYLSTGGICRDNTGFQRRVAGGLIQYGRGEAPIGPDDAKLTKKAERANARGSRVPAVPVNREYKVADVIRDLETKVKNPTAETSERTAEAEKFHTECWGPS